MEWFRRWRNQRNFILGSEEAFPSVIPQILVKDIREVEIPWQIAKFIYSTNYSKSIYFKIKGDLIGLGIKSVGLPQGCVLRPLMYAVYTRRLQTFVANNCVIVEFADDLHSNLHSKTISCTPVIEFENF